MGRWIQHGRSGGRTYDQLIGGCLLKISRSGDRWSGKVFGPGEFEFRGGRPFHVTPAMSRRDAMESLVAAAREYGCDRTTR